MFEKKLSRSSAVCNSLLIIWLFSDKFVLSLKITLSDKDGFTVSQKSCQLCPFHSNLKNNSFWIFFKERYSSLFVLYTRYCFRLFCSKKIITLSWPIHYCFREIFCYKWHFLRRACLFKMSIFIQQNLSRPSSFITRASFESLFSNDFPNAGFEKCF